MVNPEIHATLDTRRWTKQIKEHATQKTEKISNVDPAKMGMNPSASEGKAVPVSKKTTVVLNSMKHDK